MQRLKRVLYSAGAVASAMAWLPLPWPVRVAWYALVGRMVAFGLGLSRKTYEMLAEDGRRYGMGKARAGQAESIQALELVVAELARQAVPASRVREVYTALRASGTPPDEIPYRLARALIDAATQKRLLKHMRAL